MVCCIWALSKGLVLNYFQLIDSEEDDEDDFLAVNDEDKALLSTDSQRDLTGKEINALVSVCQMLCISSSIEGEIDHKYLGKMLYMDKRESIGEE